MNKYRLVKCLFILFILAFSVNAYSNIVPLTIENNTGFTLTKGTLGYSPNTDPRQLWINSFAKEITAPDGLIMNVYTHPGQREAGCVYFIYQVTDKGGAPHGSISGSYCPDELVPLRSWTTSQDVKVSTKTESDKVSFILNPTVFPTPLTPLPSETRLPSQIRENNY